MPIKIWQNFVSTLNERGKSTFKVHWMYSSLFKTVHENLNYIARNVSWHPIWNCWNYQRWTMSKSESIWSSIVHCICVYTGGASQRRALDSIMSLQRDSFSYQASLLHYANWSFLQRALQQYFCILDSEARESCCRVINETNVDYFHMAPRIWRLFMDD